ncbi:MAG: hypothetical protein PVSMB4_12370 [Ktedonobacterales bacterium]
MVGQRDERQLRPLDLRREVERKRGQLRKYVAHALTQAGPSRDFNYLEARVLAEQAQQLYAAVAGATDDRNRDAGANLSHV